MRGRFLAVFMVGLMLIAAGCQQSEEAEVSEREQICSVASFDTEDMFLLEQMEHSMGADGETAAVALYTSAQIASDGQMGWDTGDEWALLARRENGTFVLFDEYVQYGEVQFWVSDLNPDEAAAPGSADLETHIYVMVTTDVGFTMYDYIWDAEELCFWKSVAFQPDHPWSTRHSNKYTVPLETAADPAS